MCRSLLKTKPGSIPGLSVQIGERAPAGSACPWRILLLISFPISSRGQGALPPSRGLRPLPARSAQPSHSPLPFRSLPVGAELSPRQDQVPRLPIRKSRQGSRRVEETPKWSQGKKEASESPARSSNRAASRSDSGTWTPAANLAPFNNKGSLSAESTLATQSKCKGMRESPR